MFRFGLQSHLVGVCLVVNGFQPCRHFFSVGFSFFSVGFSLSSHLLYAGFSLASLPFTISLKPFITALFSVGVYLSPVGV
jgi:hypothetical protein